MLQLSPRAEGPVRRGHPWVYREQLEKAQLRDGQDVLVGFKGEALGRGIGSEAGPIAVRIWTHGERAVDRGLFRERLERAASLRRTMDERTNAYRVVHGEGDRMPGLVVDRYASVAVVMLDDVGLAARKDELFEEIFPAVRTLGVETVLFRTGRRGEPKHIERVHGKEVPGRIEVEEHGVKYMVDLEHGQKTGAFLDQRENRRRVSELARKKRVLNLFSYTGGFSLWAALGGATSVTSVDIASQAHATAVESFKRAGLPTAGHEFVTQDVFAYLAGAAARKAEWDIVISNPPSFAPSEKAVPKALAAYRSLHKACVSVLAKDGIFCASSCSSHVDADRFATTLDDATLETGRFRILEMRGAPSDHPTLPAFPEGRYLKFFILS